MHIPNINPKFVCLKTSAGTNTRASIFIREASATSDMIVSIADADSGVRVKDILVFQVFLRPFTEEEINELPPFPLSIREKAREKGSVEELMLKSQNAAGVPISIEYDDRVEILLEFSPPTDALSDIIFVNLIVESSNWERTEIPVAAMIGVPTRKPRVNASRIEQHLRPDSTKTHSITVYNAPNTTKVVAFVNKGGSNIRLTDMRCYSPVQREFTEDEIAELPPFPPSIQEEARRNGYIEWQLRNQGDGSAPVLLQWQENLTITLELTALPNSPIEFVDAWLIIDAPNWHRIEIPLYLRIGYIDFTLEPQQLKVRQGESAAINVTATSEFGPDSDVKLTLSGDRKNWQIVPANMYVPRRKSIPRSISENFQIVVAPNAPIGKFELSFLARYFRDFAVNSIPLDLYVQPGKVKEVKPVPESIAVMQGSQVSASLEFTIGGGYKLITLRPGAIPPGTYVAPVDQWIGPDTGTYTVDFTVAVNRTAPTGDRLVLPISWSAGDGEHQGIVKMPLTIRLKPESKVFQGQITTPPGTALGGNVELTIRNDGTLTFKGEMRGSHAVETYAFRISVVVRSADGRVALAIAKSGNVGSSLFGGSKTFAWEEHEPPNANLRLNWTSMDNARADFIKSYKNTGVIGALGDLAATFVDFLAANVIVGPHVAAVVVLGRELLGTANLPVVRPNGALGIGILGGAVMLFGPGIIVPVHLAGIAIAALEDIKIRAMWPEERSRADEVFRGTINFDLIRVTNLQKTNPDKWFCAPQNDGTFILGIGEQGFNQRNTGGDFIHELVHAWQSIYSTFEVEQMFLSAVEHAFKSGEDEAKLYNYHPLDGRPWGIYGIEQQARLVEDWYRENYSDLNSTQSINDPRFRYIEHNIRAGQP